MTAGFHMPGHAGLQGWPEGLRGGLAALDTTELPSSDDLLNPRHGGPVLEAERLAAEYWGAGATLLLTGGSTQGIQVMLRLACGAGDSVWVDRYQHKSIFHACQLQGLRPTYGEVRAILLAALDREEVEADGELKAGSDPAMKLTAELKRLEKNSPDAGVYIIQSPDYYGRQLPLRTLARELHAGGRLLLVDEAHGAIRAGSLRDRRALQQGADLVAQSGHKTTAALTPGAWLHLGRSYLAAAPGARAEARRYLDLIGTSSPSLLVAASLDYARYALLDAEPLLAKKVRKIDSFRAQLQAQTCFFVPETPAYGQAWTDPLRLRIHGKAAVNGPELQARLAASGIDTEAAYPDHVLLLVSLYQADEDLDSLLAVLRTLEPSAPPAAAAETASRVVPSLTLLDRLPLPEIVYNPAETLVLRRSGQLENIPWQQAEGRIAMTEVLPYPPGVPLILPGERVKCETLEVLETLIEAGINLNGLDEESGLSVLASM